MNALPHDETAPKWGTSSSGVTVLVIVLVTLGVFARALDNRFLVWDDLQYLVQNPHYRGLEWSNIAWAFSNVRCGHYMPLVWLSWGVDYRLWGMDARGYILVNILIHAGSAVVFYFLALGLLRLVGRADDAGRVGRGRGDAVLWSGLAALLFAIHPLRVESVAWVTERKDVLSGLFYLLTIHTYVRGRGERLAGPLLLYVLALLSKSMVVSLPVVLLVLDVYPLRRLGGGRGWAGPAARRVWLAKVPFVVLAAGAAVLAPIATRLASATWHMETYARSTRLASAAYSLWFHVYKTVLPLGLSPLYERPLELDPLASRYVIAAAFAIVVTVLVIVFRRRYPAGLAVWVCYGAILAPVAGIIPVGPQITADRYSYLSCLGFAVLLAGLCLRLGSLVSQRALVGFWVVVLTVLGAGTWRQIGFWHDSVSLWERALAVDDNCRNGHLNLGATLLEQDNGDLERARLHLEAAVRLDPGSSRARYNLGLLRDRQGDGRGAVEAYRRALQLQPDFEKASANLSELLVRRGQYGQAIQVLRVQVEVNEDSLLAVHGLAWLLATCPDRTLREGGEAVVLARRVCEAASYHDPEVLNTLAAAWAEAGEPVSAIEMARKAFRLAVEQGDFDLADRIEGHLRGLQSRQRRGDRP